MALTLAANITAAATTLRVSGTVPANAVKGFRFALDDELIDLVDFELPAVQAGVRDAGQDPKNWRVNRGVGGTSAASHTAGATLYAVREAWTKGTDVATVPGPFPVTTNELTPDELAAIQGAASPSASNPFATGLYVVERLLTAAELKTLSSAPTTLVAGVAGKAYWPISAFGFYDAGNAAFGNTGDFVIGACDSPVTVALQALYDASGIVAALQGTVDSIVYISPYAAGTHGTEALVSGAALRAFSTTGDMTLGDGTVQLSVLYRIFDVPA